METKTNKIKMKLINIPVIFAMVFTIMMIMVFSAFKSNEKKPTPSVVVSTQTYVATTGLEAKIFIDRWSKLGYHVEYIVSQSISVNTRYSSRSIERGDIIIVMVR